MTEPVSAPLRRWRGVAAGGVAVALAMAAAGAAYWWRHPTVFNEPDGVFLKAFVGVRDDQPTSIGVVNSAAITRHHETLTLSGGRVRFTGNTAGATATLSVCPPDASGARIGSAGPEDTRRLGCRPLRAGTRMHLPGDSLVAAVRVRRPGRAAMASVDLDYRREVGLGQRGTQRVATGIVVRAKAGRTG